MTLFSSFTTRRLGRLPAAGDPLDAVPRRGRPVRPEEGVSPP
ncbi:hypothetical protein GJR88_03764 [Dietzia sp. DQ12-45-1b]|nr:hypothetical protein GJR88_03764 [Dietzia sp. DQ12-45-1b]